MAKSNFIVRGGADFSGIKQEMDKTQKQLKGFQSNITKGFTGIGKGLKLLGITLSAKALVDFGKAAIKTASDLEEIQNVTDTVFGSMAKDVDEFSKTLIESHGIGELSAKKYASYMGAMLKSSGISGQAMKQMSKDLTLLTADMASFYNLETDEMFQKLMSGMGGATMPLKQLGINMNIANLEAFALSQGIRKSWQEMNQAEQVMLRYQYLMAVTGDAQGDFARNADNWAHSVKILKEKWQEFLGIVGDGLKEVLLPLIKALIKILDILIKIATAVEKVFAMITGKKVDVEPKQVGIVQDYADANDDLSIAAGDAAKKQKDLGKGIKDAAKAAKGAIMPFDELNILQQSLGSGGKDNVGGASPFDGLSFNNNFKIDPVGDSIGDGFKKAEDKTNRFFVFFDNKWTKLKEMVSIPIMVAEPIFPPIPNPIYNPNWNLSPPPVPVVALPAIEYKEYNRSLETVKAKTIEAFTYIKENVKTSVSKLTASVTTGYEQMKQGALEHTQRLRQRQAELWGNIKENTGTIVDSIRTGLSTAWGKIENNYQTHKKNVTAITTEISTALVANINQGLSTMGANVTKTIETVQTNLQTFGSNVGSIAAETAKTFAGNLSEGLKVASSNFVNFANAVGQNLRAFGSGFLRASAETAKGFVSNMVNGFIAVWNNFKNLMAGLGEKVGGWFSANKEVIVKTAITTGIVVGAGVGLALLGPTILPYVGAALKGLSAIPALATGGITNGPMLAMIGDNPGGREVVSPLDDLTDIIASAVGTAVINAVQASGNSGSNNDSGEYGVYFDGDKVGRAILPKLNQEADRLGYKPILQVE